MRVFRRRGMFKMVAALLAAALALAALSGCTAVKKQTSKALYVYREFFDCDCTGAA